MRTSWPRRTLVGVLVPAALLLGSAYVARWSGIFRPAVLPYPHQIVSVGLSVLSGADVTAALAATFRRLGVVFIVSLSIGAVMAFLSHQVAVLAEVFALPVDLVRSIPVVTLFPLFITLWGFSETTFLAVPVLLTSVIIYIHLRAGLRGVGEVQRRLMVRWRATRLQMVAHLLLPSIAPHLFTALRVCVSLQLILLLVAEMFLGARQGLGTLIHNYQTVLKYEEMYFFIGVAGLLGWTLNRFLEAVERRAVFWEVSTR